MGVRKPLALRLFEKFYNPMDKPEMQLKIWQAFDFDYESEIETVREQIREVKRKVKKVI